MAKIYSPSELRQFRKEIKVLRDKGIIGPTDLRTALPSWVRGGRPLKELVRDFRDVIKGEAEAIPTDALATTKLEKPRKVYDRKVLTNYKTGKKTEFLVVPHFRNEVLSIDKDGRLVHTNVSAGLQSVQIPVAYDSLEQWLKDARNVKYLKEGATHFAFRYYGNYSTPFVNVRQLWDKFITYRSVLEAKDGSAHLQKDVYRNFELVRVFDKKEWLKQKAEYKPAKIAGAVKSEYKPKKSKKRRKK
jgi:hypothetical protein